MIISGSMVVGDLRTVTPAVDYLKDTADLQFRFLNNDHYPPHFHAIKKEGADYDIRVFFVESVRQGELVYEYKFPKAHTPQTNPIPRTDRDYIWSKIGSVKAAGKLLAEFETKVKDNNKYKEDMLEKFRNKIRELKKSVRQNK